MKSSARRLGVAAAGRGIALARERERALAASNRQSRLLGWLAGATLLVVGVFYLL